MPHQCTNCGKTFADGSKEMLSGCPDCGGNKFQFRPSRPDSGERETASASADAGPSTAGHSADARPDSARASTDRPDERSDQTDSSTKMGGSIREWVSNRGTSTDDTSPSEATETPSAETRDGPSAEASETETPSAEASDTSSNTDVTIEPSDDDAVMPESNDSSSAEAPAVDNLDSDTEDSAQASARSDVVTPEELSAAENRPVDEQPPGAEGTVIEPESADKPNLSDLREELNDQFESIKILQPGQYELNLMELYDREEYIISLQEDGRYVIEVPDTWRRSKSED